MSKQSKLILIYYIIIFIWWTTLFVLNIKFSIHNYLYQLGFGLIPLLGGLSGILKSKKWGGFKSQVGSAVFFISLGLFSWGMGQMAWSYYNIVLKQEVPYPSFADVGYILALPFWAYGIIRLSKATGARFFLRSLKGKIIFFLLPLIAAAFSYYLLIVVARGGVIDFQGGSLKLFFDLAYPIGDLAILTLALLIYGLSFDYLGGRFKLPIITLVLGFVLMYVTDFAFSYVTTIEVYYNGHWVDLLFPTVMALLGFGVNNLDPDLEKGS